MKITDQSLHIKQRYLLNMLFYCHSFGFHLKMISNIKIDCHKHEMKDERLLWIDILMNIVKK